MLEIIILIFLTRHVGEIVRSKGRAAGWFQVLAVVLWIGGELTGVIVGIIVGALTDSGMLLAYLFALFGAAAGAGISVLIARSLSAKSYDAPPQPPVFGREFR
jgi:Na+-transporting methylmalonyl-CoA/oxaloacetate decarboxylase beta subunit